MVANPYGGKPYRVALRGDTVDGYVFWTRNAAPFTGALDDVSAHGLPFVIQYTVTGYPRAIDAHTPRAAEAIAQIRSLVRKYGHRAVVWRYDPVLVTSLTPPDWHRRNFGNLAAELGDSVDECVISAAQIYKKTRRRLDLAAEAADFTWIDPDDDEKRALLSNIAEIAADCGIKPTVCSQKTMLGDGLTAARCIDAVRLSDVAGYDIVARQKGNREGCLCAESRDIGAYDTCAHGCTYCYAVSDHETAVAKLRDAGPPD